jgi:hypothetical protein
VGTNASLIVNPNFSGNKNFSRIQDQCLQVFQENDLKKTKSDEGNPGANGPFRTSLTSPAAAARRYYVSFSWALQLKSLPFDLRVLGGPYDVRV